MSSNSNGEGDIRAEIVEADLVACMVALPTQLFRSTGIPVCLWFFAKEKTRGKQGSFDRSGQVLFIDARELGYMVDRAERDLSVDDIKWIGDTFHAWRGTKSASAEYVDVPGFCKSATLAEIKAVNYSLSPGRYVGSTESDADPEDIELKVGRLTKELLEAFDTTERLAATVRDQLERVHG
jgi:type I restriction enzyme M protein